MMKCWCVLVVLTALLQIARGEDYSERDDGQRQVAAGGRGMREDFGVDQWKAVQRHQMDSSGWIASDADSEEQLPRRRLRKRKRRPEATPEVQTRPRRRRPVRLDEVRDTWKELEEETPKRTYNRRRISPVYLPQIMPTSGAVSATMKFGVEGSGKIGRRQEINEGNEKNLGKRRRKEPSTEGNENVGRRQETNERMVGMGRRRRLRTTTTSTTSTTTTSPASVVDIKNLIKQNGGMSLSEILQKRNLSLSDLLKGKQQAISALSGNTVQSSQKHLSTKLFENEKTEDVGIAGFKQAGKDGDDWRQSEKPLKVADDWRQNEKIANDRRQNEKPSKIADDRRRNERPSKIADNLRQSEKPLKMADDLRQNEKPPKIDDWRLEDENKARPMKIINKWRQAADGRLKQTDRPMKSAQGQNEEVTYKPAKLKNDDWVQTEKPLKVMLDWSQTKDVDKDEKATNNVKLLNHGNPVEKLSIVDKLVKVISNWRQSEDDTLKQNDRPMMLNDDDWKQTDNPLEAMTDSSFIHTEIDEKPVTVTQTEDDMFEQSEQPVKMTNGWRETENPSKIKHDWRQTEDDMFEHPKQNVKITNGWRETENPLMAKLDLSQSEDDMFEHAEQPVKMINGWRQTEKPSKVMEALRQSDERMNDWRQTMDLLDLMQQTETLDDRKVNGDSTSKKRPLETANEADRDVMVDKDVLEAQRKRIGILYKNSGHKIYSDVTKLDVVTEPTTDKRIFVPSHPKYYTSLNYKPDFEMEQIMRTTTIETPVTTVPTRKSKLPITSAKLLHSVKKETLPPKAMKISLSDILGFNTENDTKNKEDVGPLKMLFDLEELVKQDFESNTVIPLETTTLSFTTTRSPEMEYATELVQEKMRAVSAKDEIMEILKDEDTKKHLSKILEVRNMTVDELVEQRERGSSQRHLADIFHNKTKEPEPVLEHVGEIKVMRKGKTVQQEIDVKPLPDVSISSEELLTSERIPGTSFPTYKIETNKMQNPPLPIPVWKTVYPSIISKEVVSEEVVSEEIPTIEEIENTISEAVNEELSNDLAKPNYDYDEYVQLPLGVKSAIFASLAIIGISLIVFLTILIIFKWAQRQKQRLCYPGTFKSPILQSDSRRSIRTFVSETLGRKKSVYTSRLQSMSDSWDGDKPYQ